MTLNLMTLTDYYPAAPVADIVVTAQISVTLSALIDSGSNGSMIPFNVLAEVGAEYVETRRVRGVFGHVQVMNVYFVDIQIGDYQVPATHVVGLNPGETAIVGRDILNYLIVTLDGIGSITEIS
ncbi:MAG: retroviral-like aspartic protease family protein [Caldilineaceae bacterium]